METNAAQNALNKLKEAAPEYAERWEVNPKYDVPHLGPYIYVDDNTGHITSQQMGLKYYGKENNDG
jgi:hypothetical protein